MARQQNTFAKRSREMEKKRKATDKIARRRQRKEQPSGTGSMQPTEEGLRHGTEPAPPNSPAAPAPGV